MSNQGIRGFYQLTETIKTSLLEDVNCKSVTIGNLDDVNLEKQDIFPLAHIIINQVSQEDGVLRFSISILNMDIVDLSKEETTNLFRGNNNLQDILNTQLSVSNATLEPFYDRFENELAGWTASFDVLIYNDIRHC